MNPEVDTYLLQGCMRCPLGATPECKVHAWQEELKALRSILLSCGLTEEVKWSVPCYTYKGKNVALLAAFKDFCCISFFKGTLLKDSEGILASPGENSQAIKQARFTSVGEVAEREDTLKDYIYEALEIEKAGLKVAFKQKEELAYPEELLHKFEENAALEAAFQALTPGRQRGYILFFTGAKQAKTRAGRIDKMTPQILAGRGMHDR